MSLGIVFKGPEGIVLAADSRVTLTTQAPDPSGKVLVLQSHYDNATKLLKVAGQDRVAAVTYGVGALGVQAPRAAHSFIPEFEATLKGKTFGVEEFANQLSRFYLDEWNKLMQGIPLHDNLHFLVGGFDTPEAAYGRVFEIAIPSSPNPKEWHAGEFGAVWGGQTQIADRLMRGHDLRLEAALISELSIGADKQKALKEVLKALSVPIPYQFLPLQDCVDLSIFLVRATMAIQKWQIGVRGVGGAIDVATITRSGYQAIQEKTIRGEFGHPPPGAFGMGVSE